MAELEIRNFARNFLNLINNKNSEISSLKSENSRLKPAVKQLEEPGKRLTVEGVLEGGDVGKTA